MAKNVISRGGIHEPPRNQDLAFLKQYPAAYRDPLQETELPSMLQSIWIRKAMVYYRVVFGLVAGLMGWGIGEILLLVGEAYWEQAWMLWHMAFITSIAIGLSVAESVVSRNWYLALKNLALSFLLGLSGGFLYFIFSTSYYFYRFKMDIPIFLQCLIKYTVVWSAAYLFVATAPGILMWNGKKFLFGILGAFFGALLSIALTEFVYMVAPFTILARFVSIVSFGIGAGLFITLLENVAKRTWLSVQGGNLAGRQFILYKKLTSIGSHVASDIFLFNDARVATFHANIFFQGNGYLLNATSSYPILLNGSSVRRSRLKNGDQIQIGNTLLLFRTKKKIY